MYFLNLIIENMELNNITIIRCNDKGEWMELTNKISITISQNNILCQDIINHVIILNIPCLSITNIKRISLNTVLIICKNINVGLRFNGSSDQIDLFLQSAKDYKINILIHSNKQQQLPLLPQQEDHHHQQQQQQQHPHISIEDQNRNSIFEVIGNNPSMLSIPSLQDPLVQEYILMLLHAEDFKLFVKDIKKLVEKIDDNRRSTTL